MDVATLMSVKDVAARAKRRDGGIGLGKRYIQEEIGRGNLKATLVTPLAGKPYFVITEEDFLEWESKRGRPPQENEP
jgi:hypothetical protein